MDDGTARLEHRGAALQITVNEHHHHYGDTVGGDKVGGDKVGRDKIDAARSVSEGAVLVEGDALGSVIEAGSLDAPEPSRNDAISLALRSVAVIAICVAAILYLLGLTTEAAASFAVGIVSAAGLLAT